MTEAEWLECADPGPMLKSLRGKASDRKLRLFAVACCHRVRAYIKDERSQAAVEFAERNSEKGVARQRGRPGVFRAAMIVCREAEAHSRRTNNLSEHMARMVAVNAANAALALIQPRAAWAAEFAAGFSAQLSALVRQLADPMSASAGFDVAAMRPEKEHQAALLRCIFGNPFGPVAPDPAWWTPATGTLAATMYETRDFAAMPLLADILEEAGCPAEVSEHCRGPGPHVRGCWVVDLVLGKE
jgi:hypothetical protein